MKENYTFNEENMNITYFQLKNNLLSPIRKIIYDIYYYEINLEVIHSIINETQKIMREDTLKLIEILKNNLVDKNKIVLLGYEIKIENIIMESLFPKIYDYSTGIFFNYTRYLNSKENRKINISEIKEYLLTKENRINNFIDDEYYFLLQKLREKAKIIIGTPKKEEKYIQPEHEEIEEKEEEEEKKTISFNETDIEDKEVEFEEFDDGTKKQKEEDEEAERLIKEFCEGCRNGTNINETCDRCNEEEYEFEFEDEDEDNYNDYKEEIRILNLKLNENKDNDYYEKNEEEKIKNRRLINLKLNENKKDDYYENYEEEKIKHEIKRLYLINEIKYKRFRELDENDDEIKNFTNDFIININSYSNDLSSQFINIFSNEKINENFIKNISNFDDEFFHIKLNLNETISNNNFEDSLDLIQLVCKQKSDKEISNFRIILENQIFKYFINTLNSFSDSYGNAFIEPNIQTIINNNLTKTFNLINNKVEEIYSYMLYLIEPINQIHQLTYNSLLELFDNIYNYVEDNIKYFYNNIINDEYENIIKDISNEITDYYVDKILTNKFLENNLNEIVFDNFKSIFTKGNILRMKNNARVILQSKSLGNFFQYLKNL